MSSVGTRHPMHCHICSTWFTNREDYIGHSCVEERTYHYCDRCGMGFSTDHALLMHKGIAHDEPDIPADQLTALDRDILHRALHTYDATLMECGADEDERLTVQRLSERLMRPGRQWIASVDR